MPNSRRVSGLARYFDAEVEKGGGLQRYVDGDWVPGNLQKKDKPTNKAFHKKGTEWKKAEWGYQNPEAIKAKREARKEMSKNVNTHHKEAMAIITETIAFGHPELLKAITFIDTTLRALKDRNKNAYNDLKTEHPFSQGADRKAQRLAVNKGMAALKVQKDDVNFERLEKNMSRLTVYFREAPEFKDYFDVSDLPTMSYLSTAIAYFRMVKHETMKSVIFKLHHLPIKTEQMEKFLNHNRQAEEILHKMRKGWHSGMVRKVREDATEHNALQRRIMTAKYKEYIHLHPGAEIPKYVQRFAPDYKPKKSAGA